MLAAFPILPFVLIILEETSGMKLKSCKDTEIEEAIEKHCKIRQQSANFIRTELGIENTLQVTFSLLLVLFSISNTRTDEGLEVTFDETNEDTISTPFNIPPMTFFILNNLWTCFSAFRSYCKRMSWTKAHFSVKVQFILAVYVTISMSLAIIMNLLFLAPNLGLCPQPRTIFTPTSLSRWTSALLHSHGSIWTNSGWE